MPRKHSVDGRNNRKGTGRKNSEGSKEKHIDPWTLENWCKDAERKRKAEIYSRAQSATGNE